jgi:nitric oxide dioxygenase
MAITEAQKILVQKSFLAVEPIAEQAAEIFYNKLFEFDPSLRGMFKGDMKNQGKMLMSTLGVAVKALDNIEGLIPVLQKLAAKHVDYGVSVDDYTPVGNALIYTLKTGLGDQFTPDLKAAWIEVYITIANVMRQHAYPDFDANTYKNTKNYSH